MSNYQNRSVSKELLKLLHYQSLVVRIQRTCRFVKKQVREEKKVFAVSNQLQELKRLRIDQQSRKLAKQHELATLKKEAAKKKQMVVEELRKLKNAIDTWKKNFLLVSPDSGVVFFSSLIDENQVVANRQELFYLVEDVEGISAEIQIPQFNIGKVQITQDIVVKLEAFPFQEYGTLKGKLSYVSQTPSPDNTYFATVDFLNGVITNHNVRLDVRSGMVAQFEIITKKMTLFDRLLARLRKATDH